MQPRVQFTQTPDHVRIACAIYEGGPGLPVVCMRPPQWSHLELEWQMPFSHHEFETFIDQRPVVRFDPRGTGLSQRDIADQSLEARLADLKAVLDHFELPLVILDAISSSAVVALAFAARYPDRVAAVSAQNTFISGERWWSHPRRAALIAAAAESWAFTSEAWAWQTFGSSGPARVHQLAEHIRDCIQKRDFINLVEHEQQLDLTEDLQHIKVPTLILGHPIFGQMAPQDQARDIAALIPAATTVSITSARARVEALNDFFSTFDDMNTDHADAMLTSEPLTARERQVLTLIVEGLTNRAIAEQLTIGTRTVDSHVSRLFRKTGVRNRAELVALAFRSGFSTVTAT